MFRATNFESLLQYDHFAFGREDRDFLDELSIASSEDSFDSLTTNESTDSSSSSNAPKKKKYKTGPLVKTEEDIQKVKEWQRHQYILSNIPKLVKTDIRRSYSNIFANVVNSLDFPLMFEFLKHYCVPNIVQTQKFNVTKGNEILCPADMPKECNVQKFISMTGLQNVAQFWYNKWTVMPDAVYHLIDTNVHSYSNTDNSKIVNNMMMSATKLFDVPMNIAIPSSDNLIENTQSDQQQQISKKRSYSESNENDSDVIHISDEITNYMTPENMYATPISLNCNMSITMHLNANKLIERFEFEARAPMENK